MSGAQARLRRCEFNKSLIRIKDLGLLLSQNGLQANETIPITYQRLSRVGDRIRIQYLLQQIEGPVDVSHAVVFAQREPHGDIVPAP